MCPTLCDQDFVFAAKWPGLTLNSGDLVVVSHPRLSTIIKRIDNINADEELWLAGDNPMSIEGANIGWVKPQWLKGKVLWHTKAQRS